MIVQPILFLGVILGFLLPWAELGGEPVRGFAFAELVFGQLTGTGLQPYIEGLPVHLALTFHLIPLLALIGLAMRLAGRSPTPLAVLLGVVGGLEILIAFGELGSWLIENMSYGLWLEVLLLLTLLITSLFRAGRTTWKS